MFLSAREAGGEARRGGSCAVAQQAIYLHPNTFGILQGVIRREANHLPSPLFHCRCPSRVGLGLKGVVLAVDLDDELLRNIGKVGKECADRMLTAKLQAGHSMSA